MAATPPPRPGDESPGSVAGAAPAGPARGLDPDTAHRLVAWSMVTVQFALLGLLLVDRPGSLWPVTGPVRVVALAVVVAGCAIMAGAGWQIRRAITASPLPNGRTTLMDGGWFGLVRHPIYAGLILVGLGLVLTRASVRALACVLALVVLLEVKARFEEAVLGQRFPGYAAYQARTGRLVPKLNRSTAGTDDSEGRHRGPSPSS